MLAVPMAIIAALRQGSILDKVFSGVQLGMLAAPGYMVAIFLDRDLRREARLVRHHRVHVPRPTTRSSTSSRCSCRAIALALEQVALYARVLRSDLVTTFDQDFIWSARAKGLSTARIVVRHAMRPSSIGLVTLTGVTLGRMIGGTVLVEYIFTLPGLGRFTIDAINNRDFMALQGAIVVLTVGFVLINFLVDLSHGIIDPRTRRQTA